MRTHYVAQLKIERVDKTDASEPRRDRGVMEQTPEKREVSEVTNMVIKAEDLARLLEKLGKHISLVEDE